MYNNIEEFREFISNTTDDQINKVIEFINMAGFYDGVYNDSCSDDELVDLAMDYAESDYISVKKYFHDNICVFWED